MQLPVLGRVKSSAYSCGHQTAVARRLSTPPTHLTLSTLPPPKRPPIVPRPSHPSIPTSSPTSTIRTAHSTTHPSTCLLPVPSARPSTSRTHPAGLTPASPPSSVRPRTRLHRLWGTRQAHLASWMRTRRAGTPRRILSCPARPARPARLGISPTLRTTARPTPNLHLPL